MTLLALLPELVRHKQEALFMLDDAHSFSVLGESDTGSSEHWPMNIDVDLRMATFGKALGCYGVLVVAYELFIETLIQYVRPYIYTAALRPAFAVSGLEILEQESWRRRQLFEIIAYFKQQAERVGLELLPSATPIQPLVIGDAAKTEAISYALWQHGIWVSAIRPPTVPQGTARLRISLSAAHDFIDIDKLVQALVSAVRK